MQAQPTTKQSKSARRRAVKAAKKRDVEAAGMWQKVQHRNKASVIKVSSKGGASKTPTTTTPLLAAKGQGASQSNQPKGFMPTIANKQSHPMVHTNSWTIPARKTNTAMPDHNTAKENVKTWASLPKASPTLLAAAPLAEEWPALDMA